MRTLARCLFVVLILWTSSPPAHAAEISNRTLLGNSAVRRELRLTAEQKEKVDVVLREIEKQVARRMAERPAKGADAPDSALGEEEISDVVIAEYSPQLQVLLDEHQRRRLWQIGAQASGFAVFANEHVQRVLQWTPEQRRQITALGDKLVEDGVKVYMDADLKLTEVEKRADLLKQKYYDDALALLTTKQRKDFDELLGERFDLKLLRE